MSKRQRGEELADEIALLCAEQTAKEHALLERIREFDEDGRWKEQGALSCAQWLSYRVGITLAPAREKIRVAHAIARLPLINVAFKVGRLSYSKVRALTRVATPENEEGLLMTANSLPAAQLEAVCRKYRSVVRYEEEERLGPEDAAKRRYLRKEWTDRGTMRIAVELPPDEGARFAAALDAADPSAAVDTGPAPTPDEETLKKVSAETPPPKAVPDPRRPQTISERATQVDRFMVMVESFLTSGPTHREGCAPREVVLHVQKDRLSDPTEPAFIENCGGMGVPADTARRLMCDAAEIDVEEDEHGNVLSVGRRTRRVPTAIRRAVMIRDRMTCQFPGCTHTRFLDLHHIKHWADGGETSYWNLMALCPKHHSFVHEHGMTVIVLDDGRFEFRTGDGRCLQRCPVLPRWDSGDGIARIQEMMGHLERAPDERALLPPYWDGEPFQYAGVLDMLFMGRKTPGSARPDNEDDFTGLPPEQVDEDRR